MLASFIFSYFLLSSLYICRETSTNPHSFIQNKPNSQNTQMNVSKVLTKDYENARLRRSPKTNPIKPNTNPISPKTNPIQTQSKPNSSRSEVEIPTGKLLGIFKPGTEFTPKEAQRIMQQRKTLAVTGQQYIISRHARPNRR